MKSATLSQSVLPAQVEPEDHASSPSDLLSEESFHQMLHLEQSRAVRSQKPFYLMLVDLGPFINGDDPSLVSRPVASSIQSATRETDVKGWYRTDRIIGVILTEMGSSTPDQAKDSIFDKVHAGLSRAIPPEKLHLVQVSFKLFPESTCRIETCTDELDLSGCRCRKEAAQRVSVWQRFLSLLLHRRSSLIFGDLALITMAHYMGLHLRLGAETNPVSEYTGAFVFSILAVPTALFIFDMYNVWRGFRRAEVVLHTLIAVSVANGAAMALFYLLPQYQVGRGVLVIQIAAQLVLLTLWRLSYWGLFKLETHKEGVLVLGAGRSGREVQRLLSSRYSPFEVLGFLDDDPARHGRRVGPHSVLGTLAQLKEVAARVGARTAVLAVSRDRPQWVYRRTLEARLQGIEILELPDLYERFEQRVPIEHIEDQWLVFSRGFTLLHRRYIPKIKRLIDVAASSLILIFTLPLTLAVALAIYIESPGPVFYCQDRVGMGCRVFRVRKFRSMKLDAEAAGAVWAQKQDPRVTRVGRWIRLFRLDEVPQLLNVLNGDMSLVGPRPERPEFVKDLEKQIPYYNMRHTVQPGVTGWAQVKYPYGASVEDSKHKLEYDIYYIKNMSILGDLKILLRTIGVVMLGEGAR